MFGVPGVGKTTSCDRLMAERPELRRFSASELLRAVTRRSSEELRTADHEQIKANQSLIRAELLRRLGDDFDGAVVIEAHSVIDNGERLVRIPPAVVSGLRPSRLVFLEADPVIIFERRQAQGESRGAARTVAEIREHQVAALDQALTYAITLGLPLHRIRTDQPFNVLDLVAS